MLVCIVAICALYGGTIYFAKWEKRNATPPPQPTAPGTQDATIQGATKS